MKEFEKLIFSPFQSTKTGGIGLGLAIVKDLVEKYKGTIEAYNSHEHGGAIFHIKFPKRVK
ncbi:Globin-coupled histidine kinase [compost metagenome]